MVAILALLVGCAPVAKTVEFSAAEVSISSKDAVDAPAATVKAEDGTAIADAKTNCTAPEGLTLAEGKLTAAKSGAFTVECVVDGTEVKGSYSVKVSIPASFTVTVAPLTVGGTADVTVAWKDDANGDSAAPANAVVALSSSMTDVVTVDGMKLSGVKEGESDITAKAEGFADVVTKVTVAKADAAAAATPAAPAAQ